MKIRRYNYKLVRVATIKTVTTPNVGNDLRQQEFLFIAGGDTKWHTYFARVWWFLIK